MIYKVLWFDDKFEEYESIIDDFNSQYIDITGFSNATEGIQELNTNYEKYDVVLLDGLFYKDAYQQGTSTDDKAFGQVAKVLNEFKAKNIVMPWFIYSGQQEFFKDKSGYIELFKEHNYAKGRIFDKNKPRDFQALCIEIKNAVNSKEETKIKLKYSNVFKIFKNQFLDHKSEKELINVIKMTESDRNTSINEFTKLRKILEKLVNEALIKELIPQEVGVDNLTQAIYFITNKHKDYMLANNYFHNTINQLLINFLFIVQDASHAKENLNLEVNNFVSRQRNNYFFKATLFYFFDILIAFNELFIKDQEDAIKWELIQEKELEPIYEGVIEKDESGNYHCGKYLLNRVYVESKNQEGAKIKIIQSSDNGILSLKELYPFYADKYQAIV